MARYCFKERQLELFADAAARAILAGAKDFPFLVTEKESLTEAMHLCCELEPDVCCISDRATYQLLVGSAYASFYASLKQMTEREFIMKVAYLKGMTDDEVLAIIRRNCSDAPEIVERAYQEIVEHFQTLEVTN